MATNRKKFKIMKDTGEKFIPNKGEMIVMGCSGVFFILTDVQGYYVGMEKLSDRLPKFTVVWSEDL